MYISFRKYQVLENLNLKIVRSYGNNTIIRAAISGFSKGLISYRLNT